MRLAVLLSHPLHRRNWLGSGMIQMLEQRGHRVFQVDQQPPRWARIRRSLRLATMVNEELRSQTYRHKLAMVTGTRRIQAKVWRGLRRRGVDLEALAARMEHRLPVRDTVLSSLGRLRPDLLLWPTLMHMDAVENDTVKAAQQFGITVVAAPASWDTLTSKGQWLVRPDRLLVWGEASRDHAVSRHGFSRAQVTVPGPAHFYPYEGGITTPGTGILVAGTSIHYWSDEAAMVKALHAALGVPVWHRVHPVRFGTWNMEIGSVKRDIDEAACVVAAFSTVVIEAALCGRPSVLVGFGNSAHGGAALNHFRYDHMAEITRFPGVKLARSMAELCAIIRSMLAGDFWQSEAIQPESLRRAAMHIANSHPHIRERIVAMIEAAR